MKKASRPAADDRRAHSSQKLVRLLGDASRPTVISAAELRHNSAEVLSRVAIGGERLTITRNRKAVAALIPISDFQSLKPSAKR